VLAIVGALLFLADLVCVETGATRSGDNSLDRSLHAAFGRQSYAFFELMSNAGGSARLVVIVLMMLGLTVIGYWWSASFTVVATAGAALLYTLIKVLVGRPRPQLFPHAVSAGGSSFPSGHATDSFCLALVAVFLVWHLSGHRGLTTLAGILLLSYVVLVGLSRVVLGVHYPTDVLAGWALGSAWTAVVLAVFGPALQLENPARLRRGLSRSSTS
jgi:undecaprenyl-diphosphatase